MLSELGREVSSVLDLDELLEKIPQLISRLTPFTRLLRLPARRAAAGPAASPTRWAIPRKSSSTSACRSARASSAPRWPSSGRSCSTTSTPTRATSRVVARRAVAAGGAAAPQGQGDRRAQPAQRQARRLHRARRVDPAAVRRARRAGHRQRRGCSSRSASTPRRSRRWPRSAAR